MHYGTTEAWINARAKINRGWAPNPRHGMAHGTPDNVDTRPAYRFPRVARLLAGKRVYGRHGVTYAR